MNIKKLSIYILCFAYWLNPCNAQQRTIERFHLSTDRAFYISGERIWLSLFCFDLSEPSLHLSNLSSVGYVELRNGATLISSAKIRLEKGRGSGKMEIPLSASTGNYTLVAYTKQMLNEEKLHIFEKTVSIVNTLSTDKDDRNVIITEESTANVLPPPSPVSSKYIEVLDGHSNSISIQNLSDEPITFSLSIAKVDVPVAQESSVTDFSTQQFNRAEITFNNNYIPEYEGEIIKGWVKDVINAPSGDNAIFLSATGSELDIYASTVDAKTGEFTFYTHSLYGDREITLTYPLANEASFELFDPFVKPPVKTAPPLYLDKSIESLLEDRCVEMQVNHRFGLDTLFDQTVIQDDPFIYRRKPIVYDLDNYTRFPTMQDISIEFISEMRFRRVNNQPTLQIAQVADVGFRYGENPLIMIDGIAIFDHERLFSYDPTRVKSISIYQSDYRIGNNTFNGIAKLNTYTGKYPGLTLGKNALILDFQGAQTPCRFTGKEVAESENLPDIRSLLFWDPQIDLNSGEKREIMVRTSSMDGRYAIIIEGFTNVGEPIYYRSEWVIEK